jgi:hypothetical protein
MVLFNFGKKTGSAAVESLLQSHRFLILTPFCLLDCAKFNEFQIMNLQMSTLKCTLHDLAVDMTHEENQTTSSMPVFRQNVRVPTHEKAVGLTMTTY